MTDLTISHLPSHSDVYLPVGVSDDSLYVGEIISKVSESFTRSLESVKRGWKLILESSISEAFDDEVEITSSTIEFAKVFIDLLPEGVVHPEASIDGDEICFDWNIDNRKLLSVGISDQYIAFASNINSKKLRGEQSFHEEIPRELNEIIVRYFIQK